MLRLLSRLGVVGVFAVLALMFALTFSHSWTYARLTHETPLGEIHFAKLGDKRYAVTFVDPTHHEPREFELSGDQWRLDARVLKWRAWATLLGKDPLYQLDRISGRYVNPEEALRSPPSLYPLVNTDWLDPWRWVEDYPDTFFMVDASYGSSVYLPMMDGAGYQISLSATGLLARPLANQ